MRWRWPRRTRPEPVCRSSWSRASCSRASRPFDLVVSNPPYVASKDVQALPPEVGEHEPRAALIESGATESIAAEAPSHLVPGGSLAFEVADGKAGAVAGLLRGLGYEEVTIGKDLAGRERVVDGRAPR